MFILDFRKGKFVIQASNFEVSVANKTLKYQKSQKVPIFFAELPLETDFMPFIKLWNWKSASELSTLQTFYDKINYPKRHIRKLFFFFWWRWWKAWIISACILNHENSKKEIKLIHVWYIRRVVTSYNVAHINPYNPFFLQWEIRFSIWLCLLRTCAKNVIKIPTEYCLVLSGVFQSLCTTTDSFGRVTQIRSEFAIFNVTRSVNEDKR